MKGLYVPKFTDLDGMRDFASELKLASSVGLDFSRVGFATPTGMLVLASIIEEAVRDGRVPIQSGITPRDYLSNMGFYAACGLDVAKYEAPGSSTYYPITRFDVTQLRARAAELGVPIGAHVNMTVGRLACLITRKTSGDLFYTVKYCLREIIRDVAEHSQSEHLLVMGQYWPERNQIELAVLDRGIGLRAALSENPKFSDLASDRNAIRLALLPSTSGKKVYDVLENLVEMDEEGEWDNSRVPRQQIVDPVDLVVRDAGEGVGEPGLGIDAVEFGGFDQGVGDGGGFASGLRSDEDVVFAAQGDGPHCAFGGVVIELQNAVIE